MPRKNDSHGLVEMLERDPRLRALPLAPRMLWFTLVRAMQSLGAPVLRFAHVVPDASEIAILAGISLSELAANLDALLVRELLLREADGALASPFLAASMARSETNRANALVGAKRRRERADARRQSEMLLSIPGGGVPGHGGEDGSEPASKSVATSPPDLPPAKLKPESIKPKQSVADAEYHRIGRAVVEAAGFDQARWMGNYGIVRQWLADGVSEAVILATIRAKTHDAVGHLGYFSKAIAEAAARPAPIADLSAKSAAFTRAMDDWRLDRRGPMPSPADFAADGSRIGAAQAA